MISVTQLRKGANFIYNDAPYTVLDYSHTHMSRGGGTIRVKIKNLRNGSTLDVAFKSGEKAEEIDVNKKIMSYLYQDGSDYVFMDPQTYDQVTISGNVLSDRAPYLKEGEDVWVMFWTNEDGEEEYLDVILPAKMTFLVADAAPGEKGDSASNMYKDAVLENGLKIRVPLFVNAGEKIRVNTTDGSYVERAWRLLVVGSWLLGLTTFR